MIGYLRGNIIEMGTGEVLIEVNGVGYRVSVPKSLTFSSLENVALYTHMNVSQDSIRLIGFDSQDKLHIFQILITINGIGPKAALNILSSLSVDEVKSALQAKDPKIFTKVSGIGKKNAERIILELAGKLQFIDTGENEKALQDSALQGALRELGFSPDEIRYAEEKVTPEADLSTKIRESLRILHKR